MSNKESGFLKIYRSFFDHFLWNEDREFSKAEAWIDLLRTARYDKGSNSDMVNGNVVEWKRGELLASVRFLKNRWNWNSTGKVTRFLKLLEKQNMVKRKTEQGVTVISVCNYSTYNPLENSNRTGIERKQNRDRTETERGQVQNSKKVKKEKKLLLSELNSDEFDRSGNKDEKINWTTVRFHERVRKRYEHHKNVKNATLQDWRDHIRLMYEQDELSFKQIWSYTKFVFQDNFWKDTVKSTSGLRNNWEEIDSAINRSKGTDKSEQTGHMPLI